MHSRDPVVNAKRAMNRIDLHRHFRAMRMAAQRIDAVNRMRRAGDSPRVTSLPPVRMEDMRYR